MRVKHWRSKIFNSPDDQHISCGRGAPVWFLWLFSFLVYLCHLRGRTTWSHAWTKKWKSFDRNKNISTTWENNAI